VPRTGIEPPGDGCPTPEHKEHAVSVLNDAEQIRWVGGPTLPIRTLRDRAFAEAEEILGQAEGRGHGDFLASEQRTFDRLVELVHRCDEHLNRGPAADAVRSKYAAAAARSPMTTTTPDHDLLRSFVAGETRRFEVDLSEVSRTVDARTGAVTLSERRDLTVGTATAGGNTVPTSFVGRLYEHMIETSAIRRTNVTIFTTQSGEDLQVPKTTSHSTAAIVAEAAAISESDPAFGQVTLEAYKYGGLIQVSSELLNDSGVDLVGYLARQAGRAIGNASGAHFVTGTGTNQPRGAVTASSLGVTGGAGVAGAFTTDNLIDLYYSVIPEYRANGYWLMSDAGAAMARKLKDTTDRYLWEASLSAGTPPLLLGRPVVIDPNVADPALSAKSVLFGDFSAYGIRDVRRVRFERSDDFAFANDLVTFRFLFRTDGDLIDETGALKHYVGNAA
jgi:HK97 family phage major capsid protein